MPYRVRPINWDLLVSPKMRGIEIEAQGAAQTARNIQSGFEGLGAGLDLRRQEAESKRRFDVQNARADEELGLSRARFGMDLLEYQERQLDRQAAEEDALEDLGIVSEQAVQEAATQGQVNPVTAQSLWDLANNLGGPNRALSKLVDT